MRATYKLTGIDRHDGHRRTEVIQAWNPENATEAANRMGLLVDIDDGIEQLPTVRWSPHNLVFAVLKTLAFFAAFAVLIFGLQAATSAIQETVVVSLACFLGIVARIFQAEEHSRGNSRQVR